MQELQTRVIKLKAKVKVLNQNLRRKGKKIQSLQDLLAGLKEEEECISNQQLDLINHNFEGVAKQLFSDQAQNMTFSTKMSHCYGQENQTICHDITLLFTQSL